MSAVEQGEVAGTGEKGRKEESKSLGVAVYEREC